MKDALIKATIELEKTKGEIVNKTLDVLNNNSEKRKAKNLTSSPGLNDSYELNKSVLSAVYESKGIITNTKS